MADINAILRNAELRREAERRKLKDGAPEGNNNGKPLLDSEEVVTVVQAVKDAFIRLSEQIPKTKIHKKDPDDEWDYERDETHITDWCARKINQLKNQLIWQHSILLQFIRENQIWQSQMDQIARKMKNWDKQSAKYLRREYVAKEHDELMRIIMHPLQARMKK